MVVEPAGELVTSAGAGLPSPQGQEERLGKLLLSALIPFRREESWRYGRGLWG